MCEFGHLLNLISLRGCRSPGKALCHRLGWMSDALETFYQNIAGQELRSPMWYLKETEKERERKYHSNNNNYITRGCAVCVEEQRQRGISTKRPVWELNPFMHVPDFTTSHLDTFIFY